MNELINNYFGAEDAIVKRLEEQVPELKAVLTPFSIGDMVESSQPSPAVHVIYGGDVVSGNETGNGARRTIDQRWLVVLAVRTPKAQLQNTSEIRVLSGELIPKVLRSLQGWAPVEWMRPLGRVSGPAAGYSSSFAYFPFMFEGRIIT
jgi:hypothetical protein